MKCWHWLQAFYKQNIRNIMLGWIIAVSVGAAWVGVAFGYHKQVKFIIRTSLPVPKAYLASRGSWHDAFCNNTTGNPCRLVPVTDITQEALDERVPRWVQEKVSASARNIVDKLEGFTLLPVWRLASFACCFQGEPYEAGYVLAESLETLITFEYCPDHLIRIGSVNKRHCKAPPMLPFPIVVCQASRANATWPDHHHNWFEAPHEVTCRIPPHSVGVWDETEEPWKPYVTYNIITVAMRFLTPLPCFRFDERALAMARKALGLPVGPESPPLNTAAVNALADQLRLEVEQIRESARGMFTELSSTQADLRQISTGQVDALIAHPKFSELIDAIGSGLPPPPSVVEPVASESASATGSDDGFTEGDVHDWIHQALQEWKPVIEAPALTGQVCLELLANTAPTEGTLFVNTLRELLQADHQACDWLSLKKEVRGMNFITMKAVNVLCQKLVLSPDFAPEWEEFVRQNPDLTRELGVMPRPSPFSARAATPSASGQSSASAQQAAAKYLFGSRRT